MESVTKLYRRWQSMNMRCNYPKAKGYANYGGRGIRVCDQWSKSNPLGYENFKKWMIEHGYDETLPRGSQTIDRIDCNGDYSPSNCRLISNFEQQANTRKNLKVTYKGETHHIAEWARILGCGRNFLYGRLRKGMSVKDAFETPVKNTNIKYDFQFMGKEYHSLSEVAADYSIKMKRLSYLIHKGISIDDAISQLLKERG